jgi:CTP:molybdopterin cytidylyltransferase MocA
MSRPSVVVAVLAAGASRRLGRPKQLEPIGGEPLLRRQCRCALAAEIGEVVAVLGCNADQYQRVINDLRVVVRVNRGWAEGQAASLRCAVRAARSTGSALLVLLCDQYRIVAEDLRALYDTWLRSPERACVSRDSEYVGSPAILPARYHDQLLRLRGDVGARSVLYRPDRRPPSEQINPRATYDLDCWEDARRAQAWCERRSA